MAIPVDDVYRLVLTLSNREGNGFIPPAQFNRLADQSQLMLLEKDFSDYGRFKRRRTIASGHEYDEEAARVKERIDYLATTTPLTPSSGEVAIPTDNYRIIDVTDSTGAIELEPITRSELSYLLRSKLVSPEEDFPVHYLEDDKIKVLPITITSILVNYIKKPAKPVWGFTGNGSSNLVYNSGSSTDFELHPSLQKDIIISILSLMGIVIRDPSIIEYTASKEAVDINLENS